MDRYDIVGGYYLFLSSMHSGQASPYYRRLSNLLEYYVPSQSESSIETASEGVRQVYIDLMESLHPDQCGYNGCATADCFEIAIGVPGIVLCGECEDGVFPEDRIDDEWDDDDDACDEGEES